MKQIHLQNAITEELDKVVSSLLNKKISIYQAVKLVADRDSLFIANLHYHLTKNQDPYIRLFSAWCLGKIQNKSSVPVLKKTYYKENDNNTRANIVWAVLKHNGLGAKFYKDIVKDEYYIIRLVILKKIDRISCLHRVYDFFEFLNENRHVLEKIEIIRKNQFFRVNQKSLISFLEHTLYNSQNLSEIDATLEAISKLNHKNSSYILLKFFKTNKNLLVHNPSLIYRFSKSIYDLNESCAYQELFDLYTLTADLNVKYSIVQTLVIGGGKYSLEKLDCILKTEKNHFFSKYVNELIETIEIIKE